jgi:transcriptional regulator with XRE-family HTH domain
VQKLREIFGDRLKSTRKGKGLTQEQLARATGIDYKHLGAIERGVKAPSFELVQKLSRELGVEAYKLFLPQGHAGDIEEDLRAVLTESTREQRARMQKFFSEVLRVLRRLDHRQR